MPSGQAVIYDCKDQQAIAIKSGYSPGHPAIPGVKNVAGWQLNPEKITAAALEKRTGLRLSQMTTLAKDQHIYIDPAAVHSPSAKSRANLKSVLPHKPGGGRRL